MSVSQGQPKRLRQSTDADMPEVPAAGAATPDAGAATLSAAGSDEIFGAVSAVGDTRASSSAGNAVFNNPRAARCCNRKRFDVGTAR